MRLKRALLFVLAVALTTTPLLAEHTRTVEKSLAAASGTVVDLENLAGRVVIERGSGGVEIQATVHAESASMSEKLDVDISANGDRIVVRANYPLDQHTHYRYGGDGNDSLLAKLFGGSTQTKYQGQRVKVSSSGVLLYADFVLRLPAGVGAKVRNVVGTIDADGIDGSLDLDAGSGEVRVRNGAGALKADTGSGDIRIENHEGDVKADTGSGDVKVADVRGSVDADTGSGNVELKRIDGERVYADTGSGDVHLEDVAGDLDLDTGSGDIDGRSVRVTGRVVADTGSGNVRLAGSFDAARGIEISTGSGDVELRGSFPAIDLDVETSSGDIDVRLPDFKVEKKSRHSLRGSSGSGGVRVSLETGSGEVTISG